MKISRTRLRQIIEEEEATLHLNEASWYESLPSFLKPEEAEEEEWETAREIDRELRPQGLYDPGGTGEEPEEEEEAAAYERPGGAATVAGDVAKGTWELAAALVHDPIMWAMLGEKGARMLFKKLLPGEVIPGTAHALKSLLKNRVLSATPGLAVGAAAAATGPLILAWLAGDAIAMGFEFIGPKYVLELPEEYGSMIEKAMILYHRNEFLDRKNNPDVFDPKYPGTTIEDIKQILTYYKNNLNDKYSWIKDKQGVVWLGGGGWSNEAAYWMKQNYIDTLKRIQEAKKEAIAKTRVTTAES